MLYYLQRWSPRGRPWPRGHIFKSLALASKPRVFENCPVLGSRTALFFKPLKFCRKTQKISQKICKDLFLSSSRGNRPKKIFLKTFFAWKVFLKTFFFFKIARKKILKTFFSENLRLCPWSLALGLGLGLERVCPWPWPRIFFCVLGLGLEPCVLDSTSDYLIM